MGATYLSMQLRTVDRAAAMAALQQTVAENAGAGQRYYVAEPLDGWLTVFPNFTPIVLPLFDATFCNRLTIATASS